MSIYGKNSTQETGSVVYPTLYRDNFDIDPSLICNALRSGGFGKFDENNV